MNTTLGNTVDGNQIALIQKKLALDAHMRNGINWFYWIAGLSVINSFVYLTGGSWNFIFGLGVTQIVDGFAKAASNDVTGSTATLVRLIGFVVDLGAAGLFVAAGVLGRNKYRWAVITGMVLSGLDALIFLLVGAWLSMVFHALPLWGLATGLKAMDDLKRLEAAGPIDIPVTAMPASTVQPRKGLSRTALILILLIVGVILAACLLISFLNG